MAWTDTRLVRECSNGNEDAWDALIEKYKRLIYSIPIKYGFNPDDANDIFQAVCLELLSELPKLRKPKALPKWLIQVASHKCFHRRHQQQRTEVPDEVEQRPEETVPSQTEQILREAEDEQKLQDALSALAPRCRQLVEMLFFEEPARPYKDVAASLGIATGSIGFIRQRCLERLRKELVEAGF
ncbi:MAG TPA: sigma-70 family RNA polymerase sigma factor [Candidatus Dormibacteraeota bacterium]|nr:sigma-70 family RNA polymerase sigma factor [Candidatus Dormibacteraeota bacterium]